MALPSSPPITMAQVAAELGISLPLSLGDSRVRALAGKPSGDISMLDLLGKSSVDYSINPINFESVTVNTTSTGGSSSSPNFKDGTIYTISGITGTCTIRFTGTSPTNTGGAFVYVRKNGGSWTQVFNANQNAAPNINNVTITVNNGDTIQFRCGISGTLSTGSFDSPRYSQRTANMSVINTTDGNATVGTFSVSGTFIDYYDDGGGGGIIT